MELYLIIIMIILLIAGFALLFRGIGRATAGLSVLEGKLGALNDAQERTDRSVRDEIARLRSESQDLARLERTERVQSFKVFEDSMSSRLTELTAVTEKKIEAVRLTIDGKLGDIQENNARQLEKMRETVDEKLTKTLNERLGQSFEQGVGLIIKRIRTGSITPKTKKIEETPYCIHNAVRLYRTIVL